jgi:tetratricopeptide (TPR) repeat protein
MDIPSVRFLLPCFVLYSAWWCLYQNPYVEEGPDDGTETMSNERAQRLLARSRALVEERRYAAALSPTLELYQKFPENSIYINQLARIYHELERWKEEAAMWEQFLIYSPMPVEGCPQIGIAYRKMGNEADAYKAFERCLAIEENSDNLLFMAHALEKRGQYGKAEELYSKALLRAPDYTDVVLGKARCEVRNGKADSAKERVMKVLQHLPDNADALLAAAMACMGKGEYREAKEYLVRGRRVRPTDNDFRILLAKANRMGGR